MTTIAWSCGRRNRRGRGLPREGRAEIDRRVAAQFRLPVADVRYAHYARIVSLLHEGGDDAPDAATPVTPTGSGQNGK